MNPYSVDGTFLNKWGRGGTGDGQFNSPRGIAVDESGDVYVADMYNDRIQKFTLDGTFLTKWGSEGSGDGQFDLPQGIAVDRSGNVFVADTWNRRIQKFTADGTFLAKWGSEGSGDGQFDRPQGIAVDGSGNVFVADRYNHRIQKFTSDGTFLTKWGSDGSGDGQFEYPYGIALDRSGNVFVADTGNDRVQKFTSDGTFLTKWGREGSGDGQFEYPYGIALDGGGNVFVADRYNHRIQKFTANGTFLTKWGSEGGGDGQFVYPYGIALDRSGNVYVADTGNDRIQKFTSDGTFLTKWGSEGSGDGQFDMLAGIALDGSGNVFVADSCSYTWGDLGNHRIQKFTSNGTFLTKWGSRGSGDGQFYCPKDVAVDRSDNVYVADSGSYWLPTLGNHRIQKFTSDGTFLTKWGSLGSGNGQFEYPAAIAVDKSGNIYVADQHNHRIQRFAPQYPTPDSVHGLALNGSFEETPDLVHWTYGGDLPIGLVNDAFHGAKAARLGEPTLQTEHEQGMAWLRQTIYIRPEWGRPLLTFRYRMFVNDIIHYSDFHVWLTRSNGAWLAEIKRDGFRSCYDPPLAPPPGYDLGWRTGMFDLSAFKGQTVRVVFENRNLHGGYSWGIWTYVDDVRVVDAGPLPPPPGPHRAYLPVAIGSPPCDPVVSGLGVKSPARPGMPQVK